MNLSRFLCNTLTSINLKQRHLRGFRAILPQKRHILAALQERFENILGIIKSVKFLVPLDMRNWYAGDNRYEIWVLSASVRVGRDTQLCVICSFWAEYEIKWAGFFFHLWTLHILGFLNKVYDSLVGNPEFKKIITTDKCYSQESQFCVPVEDSGWKVVQLHLRQVPIDTVHIHKCCITYKEQQYRTKSLIKI